MAIVLSSDASWKCLGYPVNLLRTVEEFKAEWNSFYPANSNNIGAGNSKFVLTQAPGTGVYTSPVFSLNGLRSGASLPSVRWNEQTVYGFLGSTSLARIKSHFSTASFNNNFSVNKDMTKGSISGYSWTSLSNSYYWKDGGNDAFDNWGGFEIATSDLSVRTAIPLTNGNGPNGQFYEETFVHNGATWKVKYGWATTGIFIFTVEQLDGQKQTFKLRFGGNYGADSNTQTGDVSKSYENYKIWTHWINDSGLDTITEDPQITFTIVPFNPALSRNRTSPPYTASRSIDNETITTVDLTDGVNVYIQWGYTTVDSVQNWILNDLIISSINFTIPVATTVTNSIISWNMVKPDGTDIIAEISFSTDDGATWSSWQTCTNDGPIPGIFEGMSLNSLKLKWSATICSWSIFTPELYNILAIIETTNHTSASTNISVEINVSTDGGNTWSGWLPVANGDQIPGISPNSNLDNVQIQYRITMSSDGENVYPMISDFRIDGLTDWTNITYNDAAWTNAYDNGAYNTSAFSSLISAWPDTNARWIWDRNATSSAPAGFVYFRKVFTLDSQATLNIGGACDDWAKVYVDGKPVCLSTNGQMFAGNIILDAGSHIIAVKAYNTSSKASLILTMRSAEAGISKDITNSIRNNATFTCIKTASLPSSRITRATAGVNITTSVAIRSVASVQGYTIDMSKCTRNISNFTGKSTNILRFNRRERNLIVDFLILELRGTTSGGTSNLPPELSLREKPFTWAPPLHIRWKQKTRNIVGKEELIAGEETGE